MRTQPRKSAQQRSHEDSVQPTDAVLQRIAHARPERPSAGGRAGAGWRLGPRFSAPHEGQEDALEDRLVPGRPGRRRWSVRGRSGP